MTGQTGHLIAIEQTTTEYFDIFPCFCNADHYVVAFRVLTKYITCPCFGVNNFRQL